LALDGWLDAVPHVELVGIFRHPLAVAQSLTHRNLFSREQGLQLWLAYNQRLLDYHRRLRFPILYFSPDEGEFRRDLQGQIRALGMKPPAGGVEFFDPALQHFEPPADNRLPTEVQQAFDDLREIAAGQRASAHREAA
jgi:hypothetical protein